jgi:hypothetical protein
VNKLITKTSIVTNAANTAYLRPATGRDDGVCALISSLGTQGVRMAGQVLPANHWFAGIDEVEHPGGEVC